MPTRFSMRSAGVVVHRNRVLVVRRGSSGLWNLPWSEVGSGYNFEQALRDHLQGLALVPSSFRPWCERRLAVDAVPVWWLYTLVTLDSDPREPGPGELWLRPGRDTAPELSAPHGQVWSRLGLLLKDGAKGDIGGTVAANVPG